MKFFLRVICFAISLLIISCSVLDHEVSSDSSARSRSSNCSLEIMPRASTSEDHHSVTDNTQGLKNIVAFVSCAALVVVEAINERWLYNDLHHAIFKGSISDIKRILYTLSDSGRHKGFSALNKDGHPPLISAIKRDNWDIFSILYEAGADIEVRDTLGHTPLIYAVRQGMNRFVEVLLELGASTKPTDRLNRWTALNWAVYLNNSVAVQLLQSYAKPVYVSDENFESSPLMLATMSNRARVILRLGADRAPVNARDVFGETALFAAFKKGNFEAFVALLCVGADPLIKNNEGLSLFDLPTRYNTRTGQMVKFMENHFLAPRLLMLKEDFLVPDLVRIIAQYYTRLTFKYVLAHIIK